MSLSDLLLYGDGSSQHEPAHGLLANPFPQNSLTRPIRRKNKNRVRSMSQTLFPPVMQIFPLRLPLAHAGVKMHQTLLHHLVAKTP
ncbi:hypothetical protein ABBQ38_008005 [Trebouxia sp. C0009 RCD-2024]